MKDVFKYFLFRDAKVRIEIIRMGTVVNDSIHVQVQVIEFRYLQMMNKNYETRYH